MNDDFEKDIDKIIGQLQCPKEFKCYKSDFKELCKARTFGIEKYLQCLEDDPRKCVFAIPFGTLYFCKCPLRYYLEVNRERFK